MATFVYGRKVTGDDIGWGYTGENVDNLRATVFGSMDGSGIVYALGLRCGYKDSGDPVGLKLAMHKTSSGNPAGQLVVTGNQPVNTRMQDNTDGTYYEIDVLEPAHVEDGKKYALVLDSDGGRLTHGQNLDGTTMYFRDYSPSTPPDPMGYTTATPEGKISIWALIERDVDPDIPTNLSPADGATLTTTTPTYAGDFRDDNETLPNGLSWDYLQAYQIQVRQVATNNATTGSLVWDSGVLTASSSERTNRRFSRQHPAGSPLTAGLRYQMRAAVQDRSGNWSDYSSWTACDFLVNSAGVVTLDGTPTGKIEIYTGQDFQWRWFHATGLNANRVQIRLLNGEQVIKTSPQLVRNIASSSLPGTLDTITWAETTFPDLAAGVTTYGYQVQARDTLGSWTDWSETRPFRTNAYPTVPTSLSPDGSATLTNLPFIRCVFSDADDLPPPSGDLGGEVRIKDASGYVLRTRALTYNSTTKRWGYQTLPGTNEIGRLTMTGSPTGGSFTVIRSSAVSGAIPWNATASQVQTILEAMSSNGVGNVICSGGPFPGTPIDVMYTRALAMVNVAGMGLNSNSLTGGSTPTVSPSTLQHGADGDIPDYGTYKIDARSGDGTVNSAWSAERTFVYAPGPVVTFDSPTEGEVITTDSPFYNWSVSSTQVQKQTQVWDDDSGQQVHNSGPILDASTHYSQPPNILRNLHNYRALVTIVDSVALIGLSEMRRFRLEYTPPDPVSDFVATPELAAYDVVPSAVLLSWTPWDGDPNIFAGYALRRRDSGLPIARATAIGYFPNQEQASWIDYIPPSGVEQTYSLEVLVRQGLDLLTSVPVESPASIRLRGSVVCDVRAGGSTRLVFDSLKDRARNPYRDQVELPTWEGGPPYIYEGPTAYDTLKLSGKLRRSADVDLPELEAQFDRLIGIRADNSPVVVCYRDDLSRRMFLRLRKPSFSDGLVRVGTVQFEGTETVHNEEVTLPNG